MKIEQYLATLPNRAKNVLCVTALLFGAGFVGCKGTPFSFPQSLTGNGASSRVPAPPTGSFQVPSTYNGNTGGATSSSGGLNSSSFGTAPNTLNKTSQSNLPISNFVNSISQAESQLLNATNNARTTVNRTADAVNSRVEQASARVDRFGQGVVQASNIIAEAATAPPTFTNANDPNLASELSPQIEMPNSTSGRIGDSDASGAATWRTPIRK